MVKVRKSSTASEGVRHRILAAAEKLFSRQGIGSVSLREIAVAAGQGNTNAVQYHFGSKDGLLQAIFQTHLDELDQKRGVLLAKVEREGRLQDARALLDIMCLPLLDQVDTEGHHIYAGFLAHYLLGHRGLDSRSANHDTWEDYPTQRRLLQLLSERICYVPARLAQARIEGAVLSFFHLLVRSDMQNLNRTDPPYFAALIDDALETMTVAICAPYRYRKETHD